MFLALATGILLQQLPRYQGSGSRMAPQRSPAVPAAQGVQREARENTGMVRGLESRLEEEVNLYRLEEAQGEAQPESINTPSNGNQGRKRCRREGKEQHLKQRPDEFMLGLVRKEKSLQHQAPACDVLPPQPGRPSAAPHPLPKPVPVSPTQLCSVFQQPHHAAPACLRRFNKTDGDVFGLTA